MSAKLPSSAFLLMRCRYFHDPWLSAHTIHVLYSWGPSHASTWAANAKKALDSGSSHLLAFNEPDLNSQADMTVAESVTAWKQYMSPFVGQAKLGSMAVTNGGAPMGPAYIKAFFDACPECEAEVDFVCVHWYDTAVNLGWFKVSWSPIYRVLRPKTVLWPSVTAASAACSDLTFCTSLPPL